MPFCHIIKGSKAKILLNLVKTNDSVAECTILKFLMPHLVGG